MRCPAVCKFLSGKGEGVGEGDTELFCERGLGIGGSLGGGEMGSFECLSEVGFCDSERFMLKIIKVMMILICNNYVSNRFLVVQLYQSIGKYFVNCNWIRIIITTMNYIYFE